MIKTGLAWNKSCVFEDHKVYFTSLQDHHSSTGVRKRQRYMQPLTHKVLPVKYLTSGWVPLYMLFILAKHFFKVHYNDVIANRGLSLCDQHYVIIGNLHFGVTTCWHWLLHLSFELIILIAWTPYVWCMLNGFSHSALSVIMFWIIMQCLNTCSLA